MLYFIGDTVYILERQTESQKETERETDRGREDGRHTWREEMKETQISPLKMFAFFVPFSSIIIYY